MADTIEQGPRQRAPRWLVVLGGLLVAGLAAVGFRAVHPAGDPASGPQPPGASPSGGWSTLPTPLRDADSALPGSDPGWQVLVRGRGFVARLDLDTGRVSRTSVPVLESSGPVFFLATAHGVLVRPLDYVPGYLVPDDGPAHPLTGALGHGGTLLPGPRAGLLWVGSELVRRSDGSRAAASVRLPAGSVAGPDGAGGLLVQAPRGVYDIWPHGRRLVRGTPVAIGRRHWLVREHHRSGGWTFEVVDPRTGRRHSLGEAPPLTHPGAYSPLGMISPDGRTAAVLRNSPSGPPLLELVDLATGVTRFTSLFAASRDAFSGGLAWSPDSRWLFVVDTAGHLRAVDRRTRTTRTLARSLPQVEQLAFRDGGLTPAAPPRSGSAQRPPLVPAGPVPPGRSPH